MSILYFNRLTKFTFIFDVLLLNSVMLIAHYLIFGNTQLNRASAIFISLANASWVLIATLNNNYRIFQHLKVSDMVDKFMMTIIYQGVLVFSIIYFFRIADISRGFVMITFCFFALGVILQRILLSYHIHSSRTKDHLKKNVLVWGNSQIADSLIRFFQDNPGLGYNQYDVVEENQLICLTKSIDLQKNKPDEIFVCYKEMSIQALDKIILFCKSNGIDLHVVFDQFIKNVGNGGTYEKPPILHLTNQNTISRKIRLLKRMFDIMFSLVVMIIGSPIFLLVYLITKFSSPGGAFYKQERIGQNEEPFFIYKFRSMRQDAEKAGPQLSKDHDPRITKWGKIIRKTRLDELPQFWNVLKGDMSVVGYRPERKHFIDEISIHAPEYKEMLNHRPGITSMGQVHFGYAENVDQMRERLKYDLLYFRNPTLNVDLGIIFKTVRVMARASGK